MAKTKTELLEQSEEEIFSLIKEGKTLFAIAQEYGVDRGNFCKWLDADPHRSARAREARISAAAAWDEKAERGIAEAADPFELAKAKELAHHYRWRASKINPQYSDKMQIGGDPNGVPIKTESTVTLTAEDAYKRMLGG